MITYYYYLNAQIQVADHADITKKATLSDC
jgi:hypothetical protein